MLTVTRSFAVGKGLSETQKRILLWADERKTKDHPLPPWFDLLSQPGKTELAASVVDKDPGSWTTSDVASVSRSLRRLCQRGLIERIPMIDMAKGRVGKRTGRIYLTEKGKEMIALLKSSV
jgi:hypothetical protein